MKDYTGKPRRRRPSITFEFAENGEYLKMIYLNAETEADQKVLERELNRLLKPGHFKWARRLFNWG